MNPILIWQAVKTFGPWVAGAIALAAVAALVLDRNHLAELNQKHQQCVEAVQAKPGAKPLAGVCDAPIATAAAIAANALACDAALPAARQGAIPTTCSRPVADVLTASLASAGEAANLRTQLSKATADRDAAVARASTRAQQAAQRTTHDQALLDAAPPGADGLRQCDAVCLRGLSGQP